MLSTPTTSITDRAHDILRQGDQKLDAIFKPRNVAVIGATETPGSVGRTLLRNLISTPFGGTVFPSIPSVPACREFAPTRVHPFPLRGGWTPPWTRLLSAGGSSSPPPCGAGGSGSAG
jgi:hypothetical protein